VPPIK
jgi:hypothetical protein